MALYQRAPYQTADRQELIGDESDQEEDALVNDYQEQVHYDNGMVELDQITSLGGGGQLQDMQAQLAAAATPLEYQATLETKFASYDNYCNLFHYILNSDGPVDLEVPSVSSFSPYFQTHTHLLTKDSSTIGPGTSSTSSSINSNPSAATATASRAPAPMTKKPSSCATTQIHGVATPFSTCSTL